ncbi:tetratricopeptide repeat protein [Streptomyces javensis]|uniref:ATP-binding protein n=1 Tax=Streptomyces javensis TaxID=114698 RepID=UPI0033C0B003
MVGDKWLGERNWLIAPEFTEPTALHGPTAPHEPTALRDPTALHTPPAADAPLVRPAQLPAVASDFTGRANAVRELSGLLAAQGGAPPILAVSGIGGIGKTALAVHVAHAARRHFPDGQLYADLRGAGPSPAEPDAVLAAFLRALGVPDAAIPDGTEERTALYRSALAGRRVLVLLDNARDADQIRPLLPGDGPDGRAAPHGCATLITGRATMAGLDGAHPVDLDVMSPEEAFSLFALIVGEERAAVEREEVMDVLASCGFLPLAIRIAASRLASRRTWTVSVLARKLADERRRLDELRAGDLAVKASFELGYGQLEPEQARAFRLLGLAGGPDISLPAAAAVLGLDVAASRTLMESLVGTSLLEPTVPGRYRLHDLLRLYARTCAERDDLPEAEREAALSRLLDFYLATAARVYAAERPGDRTVEHLAPTTRPGLTFESSGAALDWLFTEADCLIACARQCVSDGRRRRVADLLTAALDLAESGARSHQYEGVAVAIIESAQAAGDVRTEARARSTLGNLYYFTGRFEHAERELERALDLELAARDPMLASRVPNRLGSIVLDQGRREEAEAYFNRALAAFRADANEAGEASALSNLARVHIDKGRAQAGVELAEQALEIYQRLGASLRLANGRYTLGIALTRTGRLDEALTHLTQALGIFRDTRQQLWEGMAHFRLAETHLAAGRPARAAWHAERSLAMQGLCGEWRRGSLLTVLGKALSAVGQTDRARECWQEALAIYERLGSPEREEVSALMGASSISSAAPPHGAARLHPDTPGGMTAH